MTLLVVIPAIDVFVTRACLRHIHLDKSEVLVVDNTRTDGMFTKELREAGYNVYSKNRNIGVAASWNRGIGIVRKELRDYLVVMSASVIALSGLVDLRTSLPEPSSKMQYRTRFGWHLKPISRPQLEEVGKFDVKFHPGYYEDMDFMYRSHLCGWDSYTEVGVDGLDLGNGHAAFHVNIEYDHLHRKYLEKWGGPPNEEVFLSPFNKEAIRTFGGRVWSYRDA